MKIIVDNVIRILDADEKILEFCKKELEIENPQFEQNKRLGFPVYNIPRKLIWWERKGKEIIVPFTFFLQSLPFRKRLSPKSKCSLPCQTRHP